MVWLAGSRSVWQLLLLYCLLDVETYEIGGIMPVVQKLNNRAKLKLNLDYRKAGRKRQRFDQTFQS